MITLFTIPKAFNGHIGIIQSNAIRSWKEIHSDVEIFICGNDDGVAEFAKSENLRHIANVKTTVEGTPILDSIFRQVANQAKNQVLCFVNTDIILFDDVLKPLNRMSYKDYLIVGPRYNVDIEEEIVFDGVGNWKKYVLDLVDLNKNSGRFGSDFFIFPKTSVCTNIPPFAVGRPAWDNWMFFNALRKNIPLIDSCKTIINVHQNHDYSHMKETHLNFAWEGPEGNRNRFLYLEDVLSGSLIPEVVFAELIEQIKNLKQLAGEEQTRQLRSVLFPYSFDRTEANHILLEDGRVKPLPLKKRFFGYCKYAHILKPDRTNLNHWAYRIRNIWQILSPDRSEDTLLIDSNHRR
jgi:hypothetical protein